MQRDGQWAQQDCRRPSTVQWRSTDRPAPLYDPPALRTWSGFTLRQKHRWVSLGSLSGHFSVLLLLFSDTYRCCICVSGERWWPGTWSKPCSLSSRWGSGGWTQTIALETQNHTALTNWCFLTAIPVDYFEQLLSCNVAKLLLSGEVPNFFCNLNCTWYFTLVFCFFVFVWLCEEMVLLGWDKMLCYSTVRIARLLGSSKISPRANKSSNSLSWSGKRIKHIVFFPKLMMEVPKKWAFSLPSLLCWVLHMCSTDWALVRRWHAGNISTFLEKGV